MTTDSRLFTHLMIILSFLFQGQPEGDRPPWLCSESRKDPGILRWVLSGPPCPVMVMSQFLVLESVETLNKTLQRSRRTWWRERTVYLLSEEKFLLLKVCFVSVCICMPLCMCVFVCLYLCRYRQDSEEGILFLTAGVTDICETPGVGAGN